VGGWMGGWVGGLAGGQARSQEWLSGCLVGGAVARCPGDDGWQLIIPAVQQCAPMHGTAHACLPRQLLSPPPLSWQALDEVLPAVKAELAEQGGFWVLRPDSGAPSWWRQRGPWLEKLLSTAARLGSCPIDRTRGFNRRWRRLCRQHPFACCAPEMPAPLAAAAAVLCCCVPCR
jgi:hypothetical protein